MARLLAGTAMLCLMAGGPALAQEGLTSALSAEQAAADDEAMVVKATEMIYDNDGNTVTATGNVEIYYGGRVLQADRVVYDRTGKRVKAFGNVRITERDGTVSTADELDLSDDFREGFVNSLRLETVDKTRFAASRAERVAGNITVF
ncbi:MAG: LptA/OstA family protein, partial [bacterium]